MRLDYSQQAFKVRRIGRRRAKNTHPPRGEQIGGHVLTEALVREIRRIRQETKWGSRRIAKLLGLSSGSVEGVLAGYTWGHVR